MSASSRYRPPRPAAVTAGAWHGPERRAQDPVNVLGRSLDGVCREAADAYEIAAHLEALGYDAARLEREFGGGDAFTLARELYRKVPRRRPPTRPSALPKADPLVWLLTVFALLFTAGTGMVTRGYATPAVLWLLIWSQVGAVLVQRAREHLPNELRYGLVVLLASAGLAGLAAARLVASFGPATVLISLTWWGVALSLWSDRPRRGAATIVAIAAVTAIAWEAGLSLWWVAGLAVLLPALALWRPVPNGWPVARLVRWCVRQRAALLAPALYGLGQGLLLLRLLHDAEGHALAGLTVFAAVLLTSEPALRRLLIWMRRALWEGDAASGYAAQVGARIVGYAGLFLTLPVGLALLWAFGLGHGWMPALTHFALFGVSLVLALVELTLGQQRRPALLFLVAGAAAAFGLPVTIILVALVLANLVSLLTLAREVPRYAIYLL